MYDLFTNLFPFRNAILSWVRSIAVLIRTNPFLLFTVGFVAMGYVVVILGRILNRE